MSHHIPDLALLPYGLRSLRAFQEAHLCALAVCEAAGELQQGEEALLSDQLQRAAISLYANIAEGHAKRSRAEQARFYDIALGSVVEIQSHLAHATARGLVPPLLGHTIHEHALRTRRLLTALRDAVRRLPSRP